MNKKVAKKEVVLVTGSSGFIGYAVAHALTKKYQVVGLSRKRRRNHPPEIDYSYLDLTKQSSLTRTLKKVKHSYGTNIAAVIHLASHYDFTGLPSNLYQDLTINGTERLMKGL